RMSKKPVLRRLANRSEHKVLCRPCKRWTCCICYRRLRWEKGLHGATVLAAATGPLWARAVPAPAWRPLCRGLKHAGANFLTVQEGDEGLVVATARFPEAVPGEAQGAIALLAGALAGLNRREEGRQGAGPITFSKGWRPPKRKKGPAEWEHVGHTRAPDPGPV